MIKQKIKSKLNQIYSAVINLHFLSAAILKNLLIFILLQNKHKLKNLKAKLKLFCNKTERIKSASENQEKLAIKDI